MAFDIDTADLQRLTAHWIEWGSNNMAAVRAILKGQAAVVPVEPSEDQFTHAVSYDPEDETGILLEEAQACWDTLLEITRLDNATKGSSVKEGV